jgi:hypothetical protein
MKFSQNHRLFSKELNLKVPMELCRLALRSADQREGLVYTTNSLFMLKIATLPGIGCLGYGM